MAVSIIIQRTVRDETVAKELGPLIVQLRSRAMGQAGFLTGQTFSCLDCQGEYLVISTWNRLEDWNRWMHSEERKSIQNRVDELLGEKTRYRYYEPVVGGIIPQFGVKSD
ncbi:antibiotic biosynthesis monooxygenase family protein [Desulfospira joergensenii]|uniref:antibiotic biosynthesis monooxygenase family protein n=1 Tax=Desulfospira joergensenii TaxID=53329 RepID=UPI0003B78A6F|nr:antibiotic biosynthesis monooxygenase [Desulfospira joergensenii]